MYNIFIVLGPISVSIDLLISFIGTFFLYVIGLIERYLYERFLEVTNNFLKQSFVVVPKFSLCTKRGKYKVHIKHSYDCDTPHKLQKHLRSVPNCVCITMMDGSTAEVYAKVHQIPLKIKKLGLEFKSKYIQVFLDLRGFDLRHFQFNALYDSILFFAFRCHVLI